MEPLPRIGQILLVVLSVSAAWGTYKTDFDRRHVFHPEWPAHARFHAAAYAILNISCALVCVWLTVFLPLGLHDSTLMASVLLVVMGVTLLVALAIPGTTAIASANEKVYRGAAISIWMSIVFMVLVGVANFCLLTN